MTVVVATRFSDGALLIADSRATWVGGDAEVHQDELQKIVYISKRIALAYAGDVRAAAVLIQAIRQAIKRDAKLLAIRLLVDHLPRIARFYFKELKKAGQRPSAVSIVLVGLADGDSVDIYRFDAPRFAAKEIATQYEAIGSGAAAARRALEATYDDLSSERPMHERATVLRNGLERELGLESDAMVGGLFQCLAFDSTGIRPVTYGQAAFDPDAPGEGRSISIRDGVWTQHDYATGQTVPLAEPATVLMAGPKDLRVADYDPPILDGASDRLWLTYLVVSGIVSLEPGNLAFRGLMTLVVSRERPFDLRAVVSFGVWGTAGDHTLQIQLANAGDRHVLARDSLHIEAPIEEVDVQVPVSFECTAEGAWTLELYRADQLIGSHTFWVVIDPAVGPPDLGATSSALARARELRSAAPDSLPDGTIALLRYLFLAEQVTLSGTELVVDGQVMAMYWNQFPFSWPITLAVGMRVASGEHHVRTYLKNVATREERLLSTVTVHSRSDAECTSVHGKVVLEIPEPGWYFVNVEVDGQRIGTRVFSAENERPKFSYALLPEDMARVAAGDFLILGRRARRSDLSG